MVWTDVTSTYRVSTRLGLKYNYVASSTIEDECITVSISKPFCIVIKPGSFKTDDEITDEATEES